MGGLGGLGGNQPNDAQMNQMLNEIFSNPELLNQFMMLRWIKY